MSDTEDSAVYLVQDQDPMQQLMITLSCCATVSLITSVIAQVFAPVWMGRIRKMSDKDSIKVGLKTTYKYPCTGPTSTSTK
jgi:cytochrome c biogenesis protein ResB